MIIFRMMPICIEMISLLAIKRHQFKSCMIVKLEPMRNKTYNCLKMSFENFKKSKRDVDVLSNARFISHIFCKRLDEPIRSSQL